MTKLVIKTIAITLASLIGALAVTFGAMALFAPKALGDLFDGAGNYSATVFFYEKAYEKSGDINDLINLADKIDITNDLENANDCYKELVKHKDFDSYCASKGENAQREKDYYIGNYALVLAKLNKFGEGLEIALDSAKTSYGAFNPIRILIYEYLTADMTENISATISAVESIEISSNYIDIDKEYLQNLLG